MVTINDIAKLAGVAKSTVSRHLNGGSVSRLTAQKIDAIIKETGYVPNLFAQSLKAKESRMIGVVVPRLNSFAINTIVSEIDEFFRQHQYQVVILNTNFDIEREAQALRTIEVNKMDGVIVLMAHVNERIVSLIDAVNVPVMTIGQDFADENTICYDEQSAGQQLADYVYQMGHRVLDYLNVTTEDPAVGILRRNAMKERFLSYYDTTWREYTTSFQLDDAYEMTRQQILKEQPTLIVGATDMLAVGAMRACLEAGYQVPQQISFAGFGNNVIGSAVYPMLTTVEYPYRQAGQVAAQALWQALQTEQVSVKKVLDTQLVIRDSVCQIKK